MKYDSFGQNTDSLVFSYCLTSNKIALTLVKIMKFPNIVSDVFPVQNPFSQNQNDKIFKE